MVRVINCFERADQEEAPTKSPTKGKKGGDGSLELHEFLEVIILLAFHRANPRFGEVGHADAAAVPASTAAPPSAV